MATEINENRHTNADCNNFVACLSKSDALSLWNQACFFTREKLIKGKAVRFSNIGHFHFTHLEFNGRILRPTFVLSEKLCYNHCLYQRKRPIAGYVPVVRLNMSELSFRTEFPRQMLENCIQDVYMTINQYLHQNQPVEITFDDIGQLRITDGRIKFRFFRSFLRQLAHSRICIYSMQDRPNTADSVTTSRSARSEVSLGSHSSIRNLELIPEVLDEEDTRDVQTSAMANEHLNESIDLARNASPVCQESLRSSGLQEKTQLLSNWKRDEEPFADTTTSSNRKRESKGEKHIVNSERDIFICGSQNATAPTTLSSRTSVNQSFERPLTNRSNHERKTHLMEFLPPVPKLFSRNPAPSERSSHNGTLLASPRNPNVSPINSGRSRDSCIASSRNSGRSQKERLSARFHAMQSHCSHTDCTGRDLCYVCHQRQARNVQLNLKEEVKRREQAEDALLVAYQKLRAQNALKKEQESELARRTDLAKQAAFNLGVADAKRLKKMFIDPVQYRTCMLPLPNYRELKVKKQTELRDQLDAQVMQKQTETKKAEDDERLLGQAEQTQLMTALQEERKHQWQTKLAQQKAYKTALDFQIEHKPDPIPKAQAHDDEPVFGAHHFRPEKLKEARERAHAFQQAQIEAAQKRKGQWKQEREMEYEQEKNMLQRIHHDHICDGLKRREAQEAIRHYMESEWMKSMQEKKDRDELERLIAKQPSELTLHDQCAATKRCYQCKRRLDNTGQSNLIVNVHASELPHVV